MSQVLPMLLLALAGILVGGVVSLVKQGATRFSIGLVAALALISAAGGILWMLPGDGA